MKRIEAKMQVQKTLGALNLKMSKLPTGLLDHLTDQILMSDDPEALVAEFAAVEHEPVGKGAHRVRKLVRLSTEAGVPRTLAIAESVG